MNANSVSSMRISYDLGRLGDQDVMTEPIAQFKAWFDDVCQTSVIEANALILATVDAEGNPDARTLLMKEFGPEGLVVYTNYQSEKAHQLETHPRACALFYWASRERQVRWKGEVTRVDPDLSDAYFATRPRGSQIGSWASPQSTVVPDAQTLRDLYRAQEDRFAEDVEIPRPPTWGGYRIAPESIEFWQGRPNRLHDRIRYTKQADGQWLIERLAP